MNIGEQIIKEIIKQRMFYVSHPDPEVVHVFVWNSSAAEQLESLVHSNIKEYLKEMLPAVGAQITEAKEKYTEHSSIENWKAIGATSNNACAIRRVIKILEEEQTQPTD